MTINNGFLNPLQYMFKTNLQEFGNKVDLLCALQTGGKISAEDAYAEIRKLWKELKYVNSDLPEQPLELEA
jgi:transcriptional regulator with AAA-type ATPase domain